MVLMYWWKALLKSIKYQYLFSLQSNPNPLKQKNWPNTINLFLWCQKSNFWGTAVGGSQLRLYKFPRAQPVYPHTAGKLYCLWCWSLKVRISLEKFTFSLHYSLVLTKLKKREVIVLCLIFFRTEYLHDVLYKSHQCTCILCYFVMCKIWMFVVLGRFLKLFSVLKMLFCAQNIILFQSILFSHSISFKIDFDRQALFPCLTSDSK